MDFRCSECSKTGLTEDEEFIKANNQAREDGWDGCCEITLYCEHFGQGWNFKSLVEESEK